MSSEPMRSSETVERPATSDAALEAYLETAAVVLGLTLQAEWRAPVLFHLKAVTAAFHLVDSYPLDDGLESAALFQA